MILNILASLLFSYYFINIAGIPHAIKRLLEYPAHKRLKPFDCITCLSVWSASGLYFLPNEVSICIVTIFGAGIIGNLYFMK